MRLPALPLSLFCLLVGCGHSATTATTASSRASEGGENAAHRLTAPTLVAARPSADGELWVATENPHARYIVAIGNPTAHDDSVRPEHLEQARLFAARTLQAMDNLQLAPAHFDRADVVAETTRRKLAGVFFECGVTQHDVDERGTHFAVNVTVIDLRNEDIVATLMGHATAPGPTSEDAEQLALEGALEGAMRGVPNLLGSLGGTLSLAVR